MPFTLHPLPYDNNALEPSIDEETLHFHHDKHHQGYVAKLNDALKESGQMEDKPLEEILQNLKQFKEDIGVRVQNNGGGHYNHTMFWQQMKPEGSKIPDTLLEALTSRFGGLSEFQEAFSRIATAHFASGWAWLSMTKDGDLNIYSTSGHDNPLMLGNLPILVLDLWEHAYYLKYKNERDTFIREWWKIVDWETVNEYYQKAKEGTISLSIKPE